MHRSELRVEDVLLEYEGPQLISGSDFYNAKFLCVAVPDENSPNKFFGARISEDFYSQFLSGRIDLHYAMTGNRKPKYLAFSFSGAAEVVKFERIKNIPSDWLPERGFFWEQEIDAPIAAMPSETVDVKIDGRWDIEDLAEYPQVLAAPYAFLHAVMRGAQGRIDWLASAFQRYPWRGGYSTVNFYRELYDAVPPNERVVVSEIAYASPGKIKLRAAPDVIGALHLEVATFSTNRSYELYQNLRRQMSSRELLGRTSEEAHIDDEIEIFLRDSCVELAEAISFEYMDDLYRLCGNSWFLAAKLLLAYYRRLLDLSDFYKSGKAEYAGPLAVDTSV
ncbi:hypothetical protein [Burkholderia gladioli]|uniref:hypothetical protein n=1 Tax=Burkholderia gladioli TaxID=28095 RepID=UPI0016417A90|nr:hypothetical protein [Burkholderia gladioli]